ncbi:NADH-quinone oxidoreductase subunit D-related protein [Caldiplasma sukawensis]
MNYFEFSEEVDEIRGITESFIVGKKKISRNTLKWENEVKGERDILFSYGPSTAGLMESIGFRFLTPGEKIKDTLIDYKWKERTLNIKGKNVSDAIMYIERMNGVHAISNSIAFIISCLDAAYIEIKEETKESFIMMIEIERIRSNLIVIKRLCESASLSVPMYELSSLIEKISRIIGKHFGHRYFFSYIFSGKMVETEVLVNEIEEVVDEFVEIYSILLESKIFINRLVRNGIIKKGILIGPAARGAGIPADARFDSMSLKYEHIRIVKENFGDAFARFLVRSREVMESMEIIRNLHIRSIQLNRMELNPKNIKGQGAARIEGPAGDIFFFTELENGKLKNVEYSSASYINTLSFKSSMSGNIFTDFHFNWESFGIWVSEMAVNFQ